MSQPHFTFRGRQVPFRQGDTVAAALAEAGIADLGRDANGAQLRYFCGIGACQSCLVRIDGRVVEACLTPAAAGALVLGLGD